MTLAVLFLGINSLASPVAVGLLAWHLAPRTRVDAAPKPLPPPRPVVTTPVDAFLADGKTQVMS